MATAAQVKKFIQMIAPIAQAQAKKHGGKIFPSICIAQACNESGYGTSAKMVKANAVFGIKVGKSAWKFGTAWKGAAYKTGTTEYYDGKTATKIVDWFRAYDSIEDSVEDYFDMLCTAKRYKNALNRATPEECIRGIQEGPYATGPTYVQTILSIVKTQNLTQYDPGGTPAASQQQGAAVSVNPYPVPTQLLRRGSTGVGVRWLQRELVSHGYHLLVDGIFGPKTEQAVRDFQQAAGLKCDGLVGPLTRNALLKCL